MYNIMKRLDILKKVLKEEKKEDKEEFEILINDSDKCALYFKKYDKYVLLKDKNLTQIFNSLDFEFIETNKHNFEYYKEFFNLKSLTQGILKLERKENVDKKTEDSYLIDYLDHSNTDYYKIVEKMKSFEIDKIRHNQLIEAIKGSIKEKIEILYNYYENYNQNLETNRSYEEIMNELISCTDFFNKYPYKYLMEMKRNEPSISHCGYPDYMWQAGVERNIHIFS